MLMSNLNYIQNGDYLIPDLKLKDTCQDSLGKYGRMRKAFLQENRPILWNSMILDETLFQRMGLCSCRNAFLILPYLPRGSWLVSFSLRSGIR